jgi:hypothetical protein
MDLSLIRNPAAFPNTAWSQRLNMGGDLSSGGDEGEVVNIKYLAVH